jgi:PAS domain S-box-containing protein
LIYHREAMGEDRYRSIFEHSSVALYEEDITELRAELRNLRREGDIRAYLDGHPQFLARAARMIKIVDANAAALRLLEIPDKERLLGSLEGKIDLGKPDVAASLRDDILSIAEDREYHERESQLTTPSGRKLFLIIRTHVPPETDPYPHMLVSFIDISAVKRLENRNLQLAMLVEASDDAIVGIAMDRSISSWNRGAERIYGYSAEEVLGRPTSLLIPPEYEEEAREFRERLARGERIEHFETVRRRKDGKLIDVSLTLSPIKDPAGKLIGMASTARDITAAKAVRAQLQRAQRLESLGILAKGIAHQFNNLNTIIKGYLGLLEGLAGLPPQAAKYVRESQKALQRAVDITDRLHGLTGSSQPLGQQLHLELLVQSLLPLFEKRFTEQGVEVRCQLEQTPPIEADPSRFSFVVTSLLSNALHALLDSATRIIVLRTGVQEGRAFLEVSDSGCGIPAENLPRLFSPFFTTKGEFADPGSSQAGVKGVGLSLAICQSIVSEYGGSIEVARGAEAGASFRVAFPASGSH